MVSPPWAEAPEGRKPPYRRAIQGLVSSRRGSPETAIDGDGLGPERALAGLIDCRRREIPGDEAS